MPLEMDVATRDKYKQIRQETHTHTKRLLSLKQRLVDGFILELIAMACKIPVSICRRRICSAQARTDGLRNEIQCGNNSYGGARGDEWNSEGNH